MIYLGFLLNTTTREEFVAPTEAESRAQAEQNFSQQYAAPRYSLLTVYTRSEIGTILAGIDRWPGLPSKIQPTLEQVVERVSVKRALPPLRRETPAQPAFDGGRIEQVREAVKGADPAVQALAARLLAATGAPQAILPAISKPAAAPVMPQPKPVQQQRVSLIQALKTMR